MGPIKIEIPSVLVLAEGKTDRDRDQAKGHLFEVFIATLLQHYGFEAPLSSTVNVTSQGIELDIVSRHTLTNQRLVAECKACSTNLKSKELTNFLGKLTSERYGEPKTIGLFVALPGLVAQGKEKLRQILANDQDFLAIQAEELGKKLREHKIIQDPPSTAEILSEPAILVTQHGVFSASKALDPQTRRPMYVRVWRVGGQVPQAAMELIANSVYSAGLAVREFAELTLLSLPTPPTESTIVHVKGSSADFEYQLPASPPFFVGRRRAVKQLIPLLEPDSSEGRVIVLNGQSGWGKSSLALKLSDRVREQGGVGIVFDTRTASSPQYIWTVLNESAAKAEAEGVLKLPHDASFAGLRSAINSFQRAEWNSPRKPLLIFFDQFENVFRDPALTREFRDLAFSARELRVPIVVGFAWKTDLVALSEQHPHLLRDEIRSESLIINVDRFGPSDIDKLLQRLSKAASEKLVVELKRRLREYSQGLPWLFKKLASHILEELRAGLSQDDLISESLNVRKLFEADLAGLQPEERGALHTVARLTPMRISDLVDLVPREIVQTLLYKRLIVSLGEYVDTYWDIFRDFLNTGEVPIQESYILRQTPNRVAKLLAVVANNGGKISVDDAARKLSTTEKVIFNLQQDLRQTGVLLRTPGYVQIPDELVESENVASAAAERVSIALRRNRAFTILTTEIERRDGELPVAVFAELLPDAFPAVVGTAKTWRTYALSFLHWFSFAGLVTVKRGIVTIGGLKDAKLEFISAARDVLGDRRAKVFPQAAPSPSLEVLRYLAGVGSEPKFSRKAFKKAIFDLMALGAAVPGMRNRIVLTQPSVLDAAGLLIPEVLLTLLIRVPGGAEAIEALEKNPSIHRVEVGVILERGYGTSWSKYNRRNAGTYFRAWASIAGIHVARSRSVRSIEDEGTLLPELI